MGVDPSDTDFDEADKEGGAKEHWYTPAGSNSAVTLTAAQSGIPAHSHGLNGHTHTMQSHTHSMQGHTHSMQSHTHSMQGHVHNMSHNH